MKQPKCYVIAHDSSRVFNDCAQTLKKYNWAFEKFNAVDGKTITQKDWDRIGVQMSSTAGKLPQRPGAQGCWFSHFTLWEKSVESNESLIIFEHDALVTGIWPENIDITSCIVKLYKSAECKHKENLGVWSKGAHAYTVTPEQAEQLITRARTFGASPVDKHIISNEIPWRFFDRDLVVLNPRRGLSSTSRI